MKFIKRILECIWFSLVLAFCVSLLFVIYVLYKSGSLVVDFITNLVKVVKRVESTTTPS